MAHFRSFFSSTTSEDALDISTLPVPPTLREMIDDIERCPDDDPVRVFAELLRENASKPATDESGQSSVTDDGTVIFPPLELPTVHQPSSYSPGTSINLQAQQEVNEVYDKLRRFTQILEKSENLLEEIEPKLRELKSESKLFVEMFKAGKHGKDKAGSLQALAPVSLGQRIQSDNGLIEGSLT